MNAGWTPIAHAGERRRTDSLVYDVARLLGSPFSFDVIGFENIQTPGPAIYLANHLGSIGPLAVMLSVPIRFYPWVIADMLDYSRAPEYLYNDFVHPSLHLKGKIGLILSTLITKISVRLLRSIGSVSIDRFGGWSKDGFRKSLRLLSEGKNLLIFPEDSTQTLDTDTQTRPFMPGFVSLTSLFQSTEGIPLPIYPVAAHSGAETVSIGRPEYFHQSGQHKEALDAFTRLMENRVRQLYLDLKISVDESLE